MGSPIATQIGAAVTSVQIVQSTNPDLDEVKRQMRRAIRYLKGGFDEEIGGMRYTGPKGDRFGLGKGIIPDLNEVREGHLPDFPLKRADAGIAWNIAQAALELANKGLAEANANGDIKKIHKLASVVSSLLKSAREVVLA